MKSVNSKNDVKEMRKVTRIYVLTYANLHQVWGREIGQFLVATLHPTREQRIAFIASHHMRVILQLFYKNTKHQPREQRIVLSSHDMSSVPVYDIWNKFMAPKRRFWKTERTVWKIFSNDFQTGVCMRCADLSVRHPGLKDSRPMLRPSGRLHVLL